MDQRVSLATLGGYDAPGIEFAYNVRLPEEVGEVLPEIQEATATIVRPSAGTSRGAFGAFADSEVYVWEVAHNPGWSLHDDEECT